MSPFPDQFSAARNQQIEASLHMFQKISSQAVAATGKLMALNIHTARLSLEQSAEALRQVLGAEDPRDLFALTKRTQAGFDSYLAYGRALFSIATGFEPVASVPARSAPVVSEPEGPVVAQPEAPAAEALAPLPIPEQAEAVKPKPLAKAVSKATPKTVIARPAAAPVATAEAQPVKVTGLKAVEASKPAPESPQLDMLAPKSKKKK